LLFPTPAAQTWSGSISVGGNCPFTLVPPRMFFLTGWIRLAAPCSFPCALPCSGQCALNTSSLFPEVAERERNFLRIVSESLDHLNIWFPYAQTPLPSSYSSGADSRKPVWQIVHSFGSQVSFPPHLRSSFFFPCRLAIPVTKSSAVIQ